MIYDYNDVVKELETPDLSHELKFFAPVPKEKPSEGKLKQLHEKRLELNSQVLQVKNVCDWRAMKRSLRTLNAEIELLQRGGAQ